MDLPANLTLVRRKDGRGIFDVLSRNGVAAHFVSGAYDGPDAMTGAAALAGFQYAVDRERDPRTQIVVAVNSDIGFLQIMAAKFRRDEIGHDSLGTLEDKESRALKVAVPLAWQHPDREVSVVWYDEQTPQRLYDALETEGMRPWSLHKWGDLDGGIVGAEHFHSVYAYALPNAPSAAAAPADRQFGQAQVVDLRAKTGWHGAAYINTKGECLFPLAPQNARFGPGGKSALPWIAPR